MTILIWPLAVVAAYALQIWSMTKPVKAPTSHYVTYVAPTQSVAVTTSVPVIVGGVSAMSHVSACGWIRHRSDDVMLTGWMGGVVVVTVRDV